MIICERPHFSAEVGMLARKDGRYTRPIIGSIVDVRVEDFLPEKVLLAQRLSNYIGRLPDIPAIGQIGQYFIATANLVSKSNLNEYDANRYLSSGQYILLPHTPNSKLWQFTESPWWEYAMVIDEFNGYIKAPKVPRAQEPAPNEIDEKLDQYSENHNKIRVLSPQTLELWKSSQDKEQYIKKLQRI